MSPAPALSFPPRLPYASPMALRPPRRTTLEGAPRALLVALLAPHRAAVVAAGIDVDALADSAADAPLVALYKAAQQPGALG